MDRNRSTIPTGGMDEWRARPGCKVLVGGGGAFRLDYPRDWVHEPGEDGIFLFDRPPPNHRSQLGITVYEIPPEQRQAMPISEVLARLDGTDFGPQRKVDPPHEIRRDDLEIAWHAATFIDDGTPTREHVCVARCRNIGALITFSFWERERKSAEAAWTIVLETLMLDGIADPRAGWIAP